MQPEELQKKLGAFNGKYKVHEHHYLDYKNLHDFGATRDGTRVTANKLILEFRFCAWASARSCRTASRGCPAGPRSCFPGISGKEMMERNQWEASMHMSETVMGVPENPMRCAWRRLPALRG